MNWPNHHHKYIVKFRKCVDVAKRNKGAERLLFDEVAFNNYVVWLCANTRVEIRPPAYEQEIMDDEEGDRGSLNLEYNRLVREGRQTQYAPLINFIVLF